MYYIKRDNIYFAKHLGIPGALNSWVKRKEEAKRFPTRKQAQGVLDKYNIKKAEVVYENERRHTILSIQKQKNESTRI